MTTKKNTSCLLNLTATEVALLMYSMHYISRPTDIMNSGNKKVGSFYEYHKEYSLAKKLTDLTKPKLYSIIKELKKKKYLYVFNSIDDLKQNLPYLINTNDLKSKAKEKDSPTQGVNISMGERNNQYFFTNIALLMYEFQRHNPHFVVDNKNDASTYIQQSISATLYFMRHTPKDSNLKIIERISNSQSQSRDRRKVGQKRLDIDYITLMTYLHNLLSELVTIIANKELRVKSVLRPEILAQKGNSILVQNDSNSKLNIAEYKEYIELDMEYLLSLKDTLKHSIINETIKSHGLELNQTCDFHSEGHTIRRKK